VHILILSHYFPPEVSAPAQRFAALAREWVALGHKVTVLTCAPNHPAGTLYPGYRNRLWQREAMAGIDVIRIWTLVSPNRGFLRRTLNYASYLAAAVLAVPFLPKADILISTSPQFFCGLAGWPVSRMRGMPWVLDIRDLWPDSIVAVGAMKPGLAMRILKSIERFAYRNAEHIVSASDAFIPHFSAYGIPQDKISVITNGVDLADFAKPQGALEFRRKYGLEGKFVAVYAGTHGMAHQLEVILQAADRLRARTDIKFVLIGDGAERERLVAQCKTMALDNVLMLPQVPRDQIPAALMASDAAIVTLRPTPLFELVIPSKIFEAMAARTPIVLGIKGKARQIVQDGACGLVFTPGDGVGLADRIVELTADRELGRRLGENGYKLASNDYDRTPLARRYLRLLEQISQQPRSGYR
jgi:colanic acid biosynthesis glycosyl transferase WcaI